MPSNNWEPCIKCSGEGEYAIGENLVNQDMAIDAGDRSLEGAHHSFAYTECSECGGTGLVKVLKIL